jgi:hypothetical protein
MNAPERNVREEATLMLAGQTLLLPTVAHLQALNEAWQEKFDCALIQVANRLEQLKRETLSK